MGGNKKNFEVEFDASEDERGSYNPQYSYSNKQNLGAQSYGNYGQSGSSNYNCNTIEITGAYGNQANGANIDFDASDGAPIQLIRADPRSGRFEFNEEEIGV